MSSNTGELTEATLVPGAFPSEDAILENEGVTQSSRNDTSTGKLNSATGDEKMAEKANEFAQQQRAAHIAGQETNNTATLGLSGHDEIGKKREFQAQQSAAHTAGTQRTDTYIPPSQQKTESLTGATASPFVHTSSTTQTTSASPGTGIDLNSIGSGLATAATALGIAAKDALVAAKDTASPVASDAAEQAKKPAVYTQENAAPAAKFAAEKAANAAIYTKDTAASGLSTVSQKAGDLTPASSRDSVPTGGALDTATSAVTSAANYAKDTAYGAANTAQSYAPSVFAGPAGTGSTAGDIASEVPLTVRESVTQAGESPEAATNARAVEDKKQMEKELLGQGHIQTQSSSNENTKLPIDPTSRVKGLSLEEQLMPDSLTPGVVKILGTEHDRSFPLGATEDSSWLSNTPQRPKTAGDKLAPSGTTGADNIPT